jgi:hypothetical protein
MCLTVFSLFGISISFGVTYPAEIITPDNWDTIVISGNYGRGGLLCNEFPQNALWVKKDTVVGGVQGRMGVTFGLGQKFVDWVPYRILEIKVYEKRIKEFVPVTFEGANPASTTISNAIYEVIIRSIAHEIGHGIGLGHDLHDERQVDPKTEEKAYKGVCIMEVGIDWINGEGPNVAHKFSNLHYDDYKLRLANP